MSVWSEHHSQAEDVATNGHRDLLMTSSLAYTPAKAGCSSRCATAYWRTGSASGVPLTLMAHWATISHLQTHPEFQGQGLGSALMGEAGQYRRFG